ncbi:MAG: hypothetical protein MHM6MM_003979 [Cercozoa sp. M6MM]
MSGKGWAEFVENTKFGVDVDAESVETPKPGTARVFNKLALRSKLHELRAPLRELDWVETAAVCVRGESVESRVAADPENDMVRETAFFDCAVRGAKRALKLLAKSGIKAYRPPDYYVEMVKSDAHMTRVKNQLLMRKRAMRVVAERRKMQKDKKYAKVLTPPTAPMCLSRIYIGLRCVCIVQQVYAARQQEKAAKKRANLAAIDAWKEGGARDEASLQKAIGGHLSTVSKQAGASANSKRIRKKNKFRDRRSRDKRNNMKKDAKIDAKLANKRKARKDGGF